MEDHRPVGERLVFEANYEMDDSTAIQFTSNYQWLRLSTLYEATHRLSDIFDMAAKLGLGVVVHAYVKLPNGNQAAFGTYDNATLRRVLAMDNFTAASTIAIISTPSICTPPPRTTPPSRRSSSG